jgi:hypothetical protein
MTVQLKRNDTKDTISYTVSNLDGTVVNLTGASVKFIMGKNKMLLTNAAATIADAATGKVEYTLTDADTLLDGTFNAEFEVTFSDGKSKTYPSNGYILVNIQANIDKDKSTYVEDTIALRVSDIEIFKNEVNTKVDQAVEAVAGAEAAATSANAAANNATTQAEYAEAQGDYAKAEADRLVGTDVSTLDNKIGPLTSLTTTNKSSVVEAINEHTTLMAEKAQQTDLDFQKTRIDNLATLPTGSTTGDAELIDARVGADGKTYANAGGAIRSQIADVKSSVSQLENGKRVVTITEFDNYKERRITNGALISDAKSCVTKNTYNLKTGDTIKIKTGYVICLTRTDGTYFGAWTSGAYTVSSDATVYIEVRNSSLTNLTTDQVADMPNVLTIETILSFTDVVARADIQNVQTKVTGECFVSATGSDSNNGTKSTPFATITKAINSGYKNICVMDGTYTEVLNFSGINGINIYAYNYMLFGSFPNTPRTRPTFTNGKKYTTFSTDSNGNKYFSLSSVPTRYTEVFINKSRTPTEIINGRVKNSAGLWANFSNRYSDIQLKPVLTLAELSEMNTFFFDGTNVYFNTSIDITGVTVAGNVDIMATFAYCNNLTISGINFTYGFSKNVYVPWSNHVRFENCEFGYTVQSQNAEFTMSDVTCVNCVSYKAGLDGFNSSYYGVTRLVNCKGIYNLDDGESAHEYCEIVVEGGEYAYNGKAGHAPVHGCKFSCTATYSHHNVYGFYLIATDGHKLEDILISNSVAINNTTTDILNALYTTNLMNVKYGTLNVTSGSVNNLTQ